MFEISKILGQVADAQGFALTLLALGALLLWTRRARLGRGLVTLVVGFIVLAVFVPVGGWALQTLENRFPAAPPPERIDGIVVLGGDFETSVAILRDRVSPGDRGAGRLFAMAELARRYPAAKLVFSGGSGALSRTELTDARAAATLLLAIGVDVSRILFEDQSRNTWENALNSRALARPKPGENWLLVTSAYHMPRSVGAFRQAGWTVVPYPVDYRTVPRLRFGGSISFHKALRLLSLASHEWVGLVAYYALGRTNAFFPAP
ncbi:MAG TPA: YdcF family protein [Alphaproteobacteria bacterium]|nr:YdcF family protein [Alphaproteobacteria bacterium]